MPGPRRCEHNFGIARILNRVVDDVAEKLRAGKLVAATRGIARERPETLAGRDQQADAVGRSDGGDSA
jgi:hypothetical protein